MRGSPLVTIAATSFALLLAASAFAADAPLAQRHGARGTPCTGCHDTESPTAGVYVGSDKCLACHGSRAQLAAKQTAMGKRTPHDNHQGDIDCTSCHAGHTKSESYCAKCHRDFTHDMP